MFSILILLLAACSPALPTQPQPTSGSSATQAINAATKAPLATAKPAAPATLAPAAPQATPTAAQTSTPAILTQTSGALTVQVFSDTDVEVDAPQYLLTGKAPAGTVLSVNDDILVVDQGQAFSVPLTLEEGPNLVEIVASNAAGDEVSFILTVTYNAPG